MAINDWMDDKWKEMDLTDEDKSKWKEMGLTDEDLERMRPDYVPTGPSLDLSLYPERSALDILEEGWPEKESIFEEPSYRGSSGRNYPLYSSAYSSANRSPQVSKDLLPTLKMPTYIAPARDEDRLAALTQKAAAPGLRQLRRQTQSAILSSRSLPASVRKMTLREALAGYGEGASQIMGGAAKAGQSQYSQEYEDITRASQLNFQAKAVEAQAAYQQELDRIWKNAAQGIIGG